MAQYTGYVTEPHATYQDWRDATLGNGYNVDGMYGNQCWDFCALLWWQYGLTLYTKPGGGTAQDCWNVSRARNSVPPFISIYNKTEIKRGDVVVFAASSGQGTGHIAFADEDYNGTNYMRFLGQNQGQGSNNPSNIATLGISSFLGAFRNTQWDETPPTPPPTPGSEKRHRFPWPIAWENWPGFKQN